MITVKDLTKKYADRVALDGLSFAISEGGVHGILGPRGAGKSTLMNIISGCTAPDSGSVTVLDTDVAADPITAKSCIGYLPEVMPLYEDMTVSELLTFVAEAKGVPEDRIEKNVNKAMELTYVDDLKNRLIRNIGTEDRKFVGLAAAMLGNPDVILLDEPTAGLRGDSLAAMRELISQLGEMKTVIVSDAALSEIRELCRDLIIICDGKKIAKGTVEELERRLNKTSALVLSVRGKEQTVISALSGVDGIIDCAVTGRSKGVLSLKLEFEAAKEIRDSTFAALAEAGCPILSMDTEALTLDDIYVKLAASAEKGE